MSFIWGVIMHLTSVALCCLCKRVYNRVSCAYADNMHLTHVVLASVVSAIQQALVKACIQCTPAYLRIKHLTSSLSEAVQACLASCIMRPVMRMHAMHTWAAHV